VLPKHLFYLTNDQLCAYQWRKGKLSAGTRFAADRAGMDEFAHYLDQAPPDPAYLVADLVEEDFQRQSLPHVGGSAGRKLVERRLSQLYRDTPYRHACVQGRASEGRRDDLVLLSALTNAALVQPWTELMEQRRLPLAAVYSAAFLSAELVKRLAMAQEHLLLLTHQSGGLRQSYFQGPHLKFSRLTSLDSFVESVPLETAKMQQFLTSTHLIARAQLLHVVVLAPPEQLPALENLCQDGPETAFHFIDTETAAARLALASAPQLADPLLLALVGLDAPPSHYPLGDQGRFFRLWQARVSLYAATVAVAAVALASVLSDSWAIVDGRNSSARMLEEARQFSSKYHAIMSTLPPSAEKPANMKAAVQLDQMLAAHGPAPAPLVALVSEALEFAPAIRLAALEWQAEQPPLPSAGAGSVPVTSNGEVLAPIPASLVGVPAAPPQTLRVEGEIEVAQSDYRAILGSLNQFSQQLRRDPRIAVEVLEAPLDVRHTAKLSGKTGIAEIDVKPRFALRVTWKP
jgi:hypothetical protein